MEKNESLKALIEDIEVLLDGVLLSGISVVSDGTLREMNRVAASCDKLGLKEGASMISRLEEALIRKRHTLNFDMDEVVRSLVVLGSYVSLVKGKMKVL